MNIKQTIMNRDGITAEEADDLIDQAKQTLNSYIDEGNHGAAHDICEEFFGLEPDYIDELMGDL